MPVNIFEQSGNFVGMQLSGTLHADDYHHFVPVFEKAIKESGKLRLLVELKDFKGWDMAAMWEDIKFDFKHFHDIEKLALLGDSKWEKGMATFCKPFTSASIKYFDLAQEEDAKKWIKE